MMAVMYLSVIHFLKILWCNNNYNIEFDKNMGYNFMKPKLNFILNFILKYAIDCINLAKT